ncbi:hypothetical protein MHB84_03440 [Paenibacillus sp. FSL F4-0087]|uniref:hypothetical protein n=1 Tax=Paenibacillus sp. FSL F4-0087 TaxID=2921368 RepID=UPI00096FB8A2|nr:hypothetical protein BK122_15830 [Paenibacillus pabuli]
MIQELLTDRNWRGMIYIFSHNQNLKRAVEPFVDLDERSIDFDGLRRISLPWSKAEKFMLNLALHIFSERNEVTLSDMDYLDSTNKAIALRAIQLRFG